MNEGFASGAMPSSRCSIVGDILGVSFSAVIGGVFILDIFLASALASEN